MNTIQPRPDWRGPIRESRQLRLHFSSIWPFIVIRVCVLRWRWAGVDGTDGIDDFWREPVSEEP